LHRTDANQAVKVGELSENMPSLFHERRVTVLSVLQLVFCIAAGTYFLLLVINFCEMFSSNLHTLQRKHEQDNWLRVQCQSQEFVSNMRNHIELCEKVEKEAGTNHFLVALELTLDKLHLCGSYSCESIFYYLCEQLQLSLYTWVALLLLLLILLPTAIFPLVRAWQRRVILHGAAHAPVDEVYMENWHAPTAAAQYNPHITALQHSQPPYLHNHALSFHNNVRQRPAIQAPQWQGVYGGSHGH
jgi:hypothetical protein